MSKKKQINKTSIGGQAVLEGVMQKVMYDVPRDPDIVAVTITGDSIKNKTEPQIVRKKD